MLIAHSVHSVPIRLTEERWQHILKRHPEMKGQQARLLETVNGPDYIIQKGDFATKLAVKLYERTPLTEKRLVVVCREVSPSDGFNVTAYFAREPAGWREVLWRR